MDDGAAYIAVAVSTASMYDVIAAVVLVVAVVLVAAVVAPDD